MSRFDTVQTRSWKYCFTSLIVNGEGTLNIQLIGTKVFKTG